MVNKNITHEDYKECLFSKRDQMTKMNVIRSHKHEIFTETIIKVALSANGGKRKNKTRWNFNICNLKFLIN